MDNILAFVLGGGKGTRLYPLTKYRSKPAVPLGGKYRLIDIPVSNCIHSNIRKIYVVTQFNSESLNRSVFQTYKFDIFSKGYIQILSAEQTFENNDWIQGTADAIRRNVKHISDTDVEYVIILSGDQLYRMDFREIIEQHIYSNSDATMALSVSEASKAPGFGLSKVGKDNEITAFVEKPQSPYVIADFHVSDAIKEEHGLPLDQQYVLANMGIYVFSKKYLKELMETTSDVDFGKGIFPSLLGKIKLSGYINKGYWEDIGTIKSFYEANLALAWPVPPFNLYDMKRPIFAEPKFLPPSKCESSLIKNSLISDGCNINRAGIYGSVIGVRTIIQKHSQIRDSIVMGADDYESCCLQDDRKIQMGIGNNCLIKRAIIDKNVCIGDNVKIINKNNLLNCEGENYSIHDGIVVIEKNAVIPDGTVI